MHVYSVFVYSVCMQYAVYSVQYTVCSACIQCMYTVCVYSVCMQYTVCSVQYTVCSACMQCLYTVCLVCISTSPHDTVCLVTQCFCVLLCWLGGGTGGRTGPRAGGPRTDRGSSEGGPRPQAAGPQPARSGAGASHYKREQEEKKRQYKFNSQ